MMFSSWKAKSAAAEAIRRRKSEHTYVAPLGIDAAESEEAFEDMRGFIKSFYDSFYSKDAQKYRRELLDKYPDDLEKFHTQLVPGVVVEEEFWQRYFYRCDERRIMAQMKLSTFLRENVQSLGSIVESKIQSYTSPVLSEQTPPPPSSSTTMNESSDKGLLRGNSLSDNNTDRSTAASASKQTGTKSSTAAIPQKNVYRPPMLRNSRAEALKAPSSTRKSSQAPPNISTPSKQFREQNNSSSAKQIKHEDPASKHDSLASSGSQKRSLDPRVYYRVFGTILVLVFLTTIMAGKRVVCGFEFFGKSMLCNDDDIVVARGSAVGFVDTKRKRGRIETDRNNENNVGFVGGGGGGGREPFGGATDDVDGSGVQAMISSWMQNVDFSQFAAAAETDPPVVDIKKPEKRGIVGFFQRRFGRKDHSTAVSANTSPGVVVHQHIHHVVHHVVHEMR